MNVMGTITTLVTFEEFERLPDEPSKLELMDGELIRMPPAETRHMRIALRLYKILEDTLRMLHGQGHARDLGEVFIETGYRIGSNWVNSRCERLARRAERRQVSGGRPGIGGRGDL